MDSGEPGESVTNGQTRHVQPPASAGLRAKQNRPKKGDSKCKKQGKYGFYIYSILYNTTSLEKIQSKYNLLKISRIFQNGMTLALSIIGLTTYTLEEWPF